MSLKLLDKNQGADLLTIGQMSNGQIGICRCKGSTSNGHLVMKVMQDDILIDLENASNWIDKDGTYYNTCKVEPIKSGTVLSFEVT